MEAASSFETGAAFAAFCVNFRSLLEKYGLCLEASDSDARPNSDWMYQNMFAFYGSAMETYFENLKYRGLNLSPETRERWQNGVMTAELGDQDRPGVLPEGCRAFLDYAGRSFFPIFFGNAFAIGKTQMSTDRTLALVLTELALKSLAALFAREVAAFLPVSSDMQQHVVLH
ncbi:MAG: hypothetical protein QG664_342 [Patescibacteria group bacterium]|nr:hypothetical protein [Patescibacteria group bacterium]